MNNAEKVGFVYSKLSPLSAGQEKRIQAAIELADELTQSGWTFEVANNSVVFTTPFLTFSEGSLKESSRYRIEIRFDQRLRVEALDGEDFWPSPHPHVNDWGTPCMGNQERVPYLPEPFIVAQSVANMLEGPVTYRMEHYKFNLFIETTHCAHCCEKVSLELAVKDGSYYYHPQCLREVEHVRETYRAIQMERS